MDEDRLVIADELWAKIAPLLPGKAGDPGATGRDNRRFVEAVLWRVRTGSPWRHLIENCFSKIKEFRGIATRYDKTDTSYAANWHLCAMLNAAR